MVLINLVANLIVGLTINGVESIDGNVGKDFSGWSS